MQKTKIKPKNKQKNNIIPVNILETPLETVDLFENTLQQFIQNLPPDISYPQLDETINLFTPSFPPTTVNYNPTAPIEIPHEQTPLPTKDLESIFKISVQVHKDYVKEFRSQMDNISIPLYQSFSENPNQSNSDCHDLFYNHVKNYEHQYSKYQSMQYKLKHQSRSIQILESKLWNLQSKSQVIDGICQDGISFKHNYTLETASWDTEIEKELKFALLSRQKDLAISIEISFQMKLAKYWIQNHIDSWLSNSEFLNNSLALSSIHGKNQDRERFHFIIHVLFFFEKEYSGKNSDEEVLEIQDSGFKKDIRGWIMHLISAILPYFNYKDSRFILLHILRCKGISNWGQSAIQFTVPNVWTDEYLDNYLTSLSCLLGPVEELHEQMQSRLQSITFLEDELRKLEALDWVVIFEDEIQLEDGTLKESQSRLNLRSTFLAQEDYLAILCQFQLHEMWESFFKDSIVAQDINFPHHDSGSLLKLFSASHHAVLILLRGIHIFPLSYTDIVAFLSSSIVYLLKLLSDISQQFYDQNTLYNIDVLSFNGIKTSVKAEFEAILCRTFSHMIKIDKKSIWKSVSNLPFDHISTNTLSSIGEDLTKLIQSFQQNDRKISSSENIFVIDTLIRIFQAMPMDISSADNLMVTATGLVKILFDYSFLIPTIEMQCKDYARENLKLILSSRPSFISFLLIWTRDYYSKIENSELSTFFLQVPLHIFQIKQADINIILAFIKNSVNGNKARLGMLILERLNWDINENGDLFIFRHFHQSTAIELLNLHLDRVGETEVAAVVDSVTSAVTAMALNKLGKYAPDKYEFETWIWEFVFKLKLYQKPSSEDFYSVNSFSSQSKPFLTFESTILSTIRGAMKNDPLCAYAIILISDMGHQYYLFEKYGLDLLLLLAQNSRWEAIIRIICQIMYTFSTHVDMLLDVRFIKIIDQIFQKNQSKTKTDYILKIFKECSSFIQDKKTSKEEITFFIRIWHDIVFGQAQNQMGYGILDRISECSFLSNNQEICRNSLINHYNKKIEAFLKETGDSSSFSKIFGTRSYPALVILKPGVKNQAYHYMFDALWVETIMEHQDRQHIGASLILNPQCPVTKIETGSKKPLMNFSIFKWAIAINTLPPRNYMMPLFLQIFMTLYFERIENSNACFGYRFLNDLSIKADVLKTISVYQKNYQDGLNFEYLNSELAAENQMLFNAVSLWLEDPRLLTSTFITATLGADYYIIKLESCRKGVHHTRYNLWIDSISFPNILLHDSSKLSKHILQANHKNTFFASPLSSPKSAPSCILRLPLLESLKELNTDICKKHCLGIFEAFYEKGKSYISFKSSIESLDEEYISNSKMLYSFQNLPNKIQKICSKNCTGPAFLEFNTRKITTASEIKIFIAENRSKMGFISELDFSDMRLCLFGLEGLFLAEWIKSNECTNENDLIAIFYKIFERIDKSIIDFPPASYIINQILCSIGNKFITNSHIQTIKLWNSMVKCNLIFSAQDIYNPASAPSDFQDLYSQLLSKHDLFGDEATSNLVLRFNVQNWLTHSVHTDKIKLFLITMINFPKLKEECTMTYNANKRLLKSILAIQTCKVLITESIYLCFINEMNGNYNPEILQEALYSMFPDRPTDIFSLLQCLELLDCKFYRNDILELLKKLLQVLENRIIIKGKSCFETEKESILKFHELYICIFSSQPLYSMITDLHFNELLEIFKKTIFSWIGIVFDFQSQKWICNQPWRQENSEIAKTTLTILVTILEKICRNSVQNHQIPLVLWELLTIIIDSDSPLYVIETFCEILSKRNVWSLFSISKNIIKQCIYWKSTMKWNLYISNFFFEVFKSASLQIFEKISQSESRQQISDFIYIIFDIIYDSRIQDQRSEMFSVIEERLFSIAWSDLITFDDYKSLVKKLNISWNYKSSDLEYWNTNNDPMIFTIFYLHRLGELDKGDTLEYLKVYLSYVCSLINFQILNQECENFGIEFISKVILQLLEFSEQYKIKFGLSEHVKNLGLYEIIQIFNGSSKENVYYVHLWNGILKGLSCSNYPLDYLDCSILFSSIECMAFFIEDGIEKYLRISNNRVWATITTRVILPELNLEIFVKISLDNALLLTLYVYILQKIGSCKSLDSKIMICEQLYSWIMSFKAINLPCGREGKLSLLLYQFSEILHAELAEKTILGNSRLLTLVPAIANQLLKWSEDRISGGLWATLGFGPPSTFSLEFRFFTRGIGTFMASRCLPQESTDRKKLIESVELLHSNAEYESLLLYLDPLMEEYLGNDSKGIEYLSCIILHQTKAIFPEYIAKLE